MNKLQRLLLGTTSVASVGLAALSSSNMAQIVLASDTADIMLTDETAHITTTETAANAASVKESTLVESVVASISANDEENGDATADVKRRR